jgi:division protein CdvB (Snf7/Vps24/ESCRT-III family)
MAGLLDKLKGLVKERETQIRSAVDKAGDFVDDKTKGKYHDKIAKAGEKADQAINKVTDKDAAAAQDEAAAKVDEASAAQDEAAAKVDEASAAQDEAAAKVDEAKPDQTA